MANEDLVLKAYIDNFSTTLNQLNQLRAAEDQYTAALQKQGVTAENAAKAIQVAISNQLAAADRAATNIATALKNAERAHQDYENTIRRVAQTEEREAQRKVQAEQRAWQETQAALERNAEQQDKILEKEVDDFVNAWQRAYEGQQRAQQQAQADFEKAATRHKAVLEEEIEATQRAQAKELAAQAARANEEKDVNTKREEANISYIRSITALHSALGLLDTAWANQISRIGTVALALRGASPAFQGLVGVAIGGIEAFNFVSHAIDAAKESLLTVVSVVERGALALGALTAAAIGAGIAIAKDFQQAIVTIGALGGASTEQLYALDKAVTQVSKQTGVALTEVAKGAEELIKAGEPLDNVLKGELNTVVALTIASNGDLGLANATRAVVQATHAWTFENVTAERAANAINAIAQKSTLTFTEVTQAFQQSAAGANTLKISIEDLGALIAVLANAGLRGQVAGTALKQVFLDLEKPSKAATAILNEYNVALFDAQGKTRNIYDVIKDLNRAFGEQATATGKVSDAERDRALAVIFGARASLAANIISNESVLIFEKMRASFEGLKATDIEAILLQPLNKRFEILKANVEAAGKELGSTFLPILSNIVDGGLKLVSTFDASNLKLVGLAAQALITGQGFGQLEEAIGKLELPSGILVAVNKFLDLLENVHLAFSEDIVPAVRRFFDTLRDGAGDTQQTIDLFNLLSEGARVIGKFVALAIDSFSEFISNLRKNGPDIEQVKNLVVGFGTVFLALPGIMAFAGIKIIEIIGQMVRGTAQHLATGEDAFDNFAVGVGEASTTTSKNFGAGLTAALKSFAGFLLNFSAGTANIADAFDYIGNAPISILIAWERGLNALLSAAVDFVQKLRPVLGAAQGFLDIINPGAGGAIRDILALADRAKFTPVTAIFEEAPSKAAQGFKAISDLSHNFARDIEGFAASVPQIESAVNHLHGSLKDMFDDIDTQTQQSRDKIQALQDALEGKDTSAPGKYPGGGGGAGGKGRKEPQTALEALLAGLETNRAEYIGEFGKLGGELAAALDKALAQPKSAEAGNALKTALDNIRIKAEKEEIPGYEELGTELKEAVVNALATGDVSNVHELIANIADELDMTALQAKVDKESTKVFDTLRNAFTEAQNNIRDIIIKSDQQIAALIDKAALKTAVQAQKDDIKSLLDSFKTDFSKRTDIIDTINQIDSDVAKTLENSPLQAALAAQHQQILDEVNSLISDLQAAANEENLIKQQIDAATESAGEEKTKEARKNKRDDLAETHRRNLQRISRDGGDLAKKQRDENIRYKEALEDLTKAEEREDKAAAAKKLNDDKVKDLRTQQTEAAKKYNSIANEILAKYKIENDLVIGIQAVETKRDEAITNQVTHLQDVIDKQKIQYEDALSKLGLEKDAADSVFEDMVNDLKESVRLQRELLTPPPSLKITTTDSTDTVRTIVRDAAGHETSENTTTTTRHAQEQVRVESFSIPSMDIGGIVKGAIGAPQLIIAHGGELVIPHEVVRALTMALPNMPSVGPGAIHNSYTYNVNASYANTQSEASIGMDLRALVTMSQR